MINRILASPKVRKFARELGADISNLKGSETVSYTHLRAHETN